MSTPTFFFSASLFDLSVMRLPEDLENIPVARTKNITPDMVGDLDFLLTGSRDRDPACLQDDERATVYKLQNELVEAVANLDDACIDKVAGEWGVMDLVGSLDVLRQLHALSRSALRRNEGVFLYF